MNLIASGEYNPSESGNVSAINPSRSSVRLSAILSGFLEHLRVEDGRAAGTIERYRAYLTRFGRAVGDCPIEAIDGEKIALYKRRLLEDELAPATIGSMLSCVRSFLRYTGTVLQMSVYDPAKIRRPKIPKREVEYLTKDEVERFLATIPIRSLAGIRDRALAEVLCSTGMRISEALSLDRRGIDWEAREVKIIGKGNKQ